MKTVLAAAVLATLAVPATAQPHTARAEVVSATPIIERVAVPRRDCRVEEVESYRERRVRRNDYAPEPVYAERPSGAGAVVGAILGGVIGHQFGNSNRGRDHATAAGAVIGGLIGSGIERDSIDQRTPYRRADYAVERVPVRRDVQRCEVVTDYQEEVRGYDVRYVFHGREYTTRLPYDPGRTIEVEVDVRPRGRW